MGPGVADFVGRGADIKVDTPYHRGSEVCLECGACESVCPTHSIRLKTVYETPPVLQMSEFDQRLRQRPTIYIPFPQALPNAPVLDRSNCVRFRQAERGVEACGICAEACPVKAIDYGQTDQTVQIEAGAVILAPGFCAYDPAGRPGLHASAFPNVVTSLQFERMLSASGPYLGKVLRPSDVRKPKRIAFLQCVGSRDAASTTTAPRSAACTPSRRPSSPRSTCTAWTARSSTWTCGPTARASTLLRAGQAGAGRALPARRASTVEENPRTENLRIGYLDEDGSATGPGSFDLVVLSVGL